MECIWDSADAVGIVVHRLSEFSGGRPHVWWRPS
jgi:hypothetical protein